MNRYCGDAAAAAANEFVLSFWCGPPPPAFISRNEYLAIKDAGFTHVMPPCAGTTVEQNRRILTLCASVGLRVFIGDSRLPSALSGSGDARARVDAVLSDYRGYPALAGYFLGDEPGAGAFPGLGEVVAYLREKDPAHPAFINVFPNYANGNQMGVPTYREYVRNYLDTVRPFALSYDHYHFTTGGDGGLFFANLTVAREEARKRGLPFWNIALMTQHFAYRNLTEAEIRWEAMQTIAYGARGLLWFTYWTPDASGIWHQAMVEADGLKTPHYYEARRVNREVRAFGEALRGCDNTGTFHVGTAPKDSAGPAPADTRIQFDRASSDLTVGLFRGRRSETMAFVTNASYRTEAAASAVIAGPVRRDIEQFDTRLERWRVTEASPSVRDGARTVRIKMPPSGAVLLRW